MNSFPGFENIKQFYDWGCYTDQDLLDYVNMNCLTKDQYKQITGNEIKLSTKLNKKRTQTSALLCIKEK